MLDFVAKNAGFAPLVEYEALSWKSLALETTTAVYRTKHLRLEGKGMPISQVDTLLEENRLRRQQQDSAIISQRSSSR